MNICALRKLSYADIKNYYISSFKNTDDLKVGFEYERLPVRCDGTAADYYSFNGVCNILRMFALADNWDYILDQDEIIGLKQGHDTLTLEPGSQIEFSLEPKKYISDLQKRVEYLDSQLEPLLSDMDISLLDYGVSPVSTCKNIKLIPKNRYHIMADYLWGILSDVMMRETAGVQATFDYSSEEDAMLKFKVANLISPFITAMFANSPIRGGVDTGYKSFRALSWLFTDDDRCGFFFNFEDDFSFDDYIKFVIDTPMLFINREDKCIKFNDNINFFEFLNNSKYDYIMPSLEDYLLQANLCFPEVRLRNFIEVRNQDCNGKGLQYSMIALYKGILYDKDACSAVLDLLKEIKPEDYSDLRFNVPKYAMDTRVLNSSVKDYAYEILKIAESSLLKNFPDDVKFLDYIKEYTAQGLCPADIILKNWYGCWNKDISKLIEYVQ